MSHFTHRIRYKVRRAAERGYMVGEAHHARVTWDEAFRTTPDALGAELIRLTSDPNVTDVRIESIKESVR